MSILSAIRREQKKVKKNLAKLQHQLSGLEAAAQALGDSTSKRDKGREEARLVGCCPSEDWEGC
jgi:hypothetical protein